MATSSTVQPILGTTYVRRAIDRYTPALVLLVLLGPASCGGDNDAEPVQSNCGGCAVPLCQSPSPCDCACIEGTPWVIGTQALVCTTDGCFAPLSEDAGASGASGAGAAGTDGGAGTTAGTSGNGGAPSEQEPDASDLADSGLDGSSGQAGSGGAGGTGSIPDCAPFDLLSVRSPADGCLFELNAVVRSGDQCQGAVTLNGVLLACDDPDGWRMPNMAVVELVGAACSALQGSSAALVEIDFPCSAIVEAR